MWYFLAKPVETRKLTVNNDESKFIPVTKWWLSREEDNKMKMVHIIEEKKTSTKEENKQIKSERFEKVTKKKLYLDKKEGNAQFQTPQSFLRNRLGSERNMLLGKGE